MSLPIWGWDSYFQAFWSSEEREGTVPARVISEHRALWGVAGDFGQSSAEVSGKFRRNAEETGDWPAVGDWVALSRAPASGRGQIQGILPRRSRFSRKEAGQRVREQVIAANVDVAFIVNGLDGDFNPRRLERYLAQCWDSAAKPVVLLNKVDLCRDLPAKVAAAENASAYAAVVAVSAATGEGIDAVRDLLVAGRTNILLGSSGVGKSTLLNLLLGQPTQLTEPVREADSRGRHTTTSRELFVLPGGALLIDTPGLRELQLWTDDEALSRAFPDIELLAARCRFQNCRHEGEPGCAIAAAIAGGELDPARLESRRKLLREQEFLRRKRDPAAERANKQRIKAISREIRLRYRSGDKDPRSGR